jgi:hypothetical protein
VEIDATEFSPEIRCIQEVAKHFLASAQQYRKDRHWALTPEDPKSLPEEWAWSYDEAGVRAWYASAMEREWPETMEWPEEIDRVEEECPPPSARRILE